MLSCSSRVKVHYIEELSELIREKAFCQPSAYKSQSLPNLPLFNIFDHFDSLFSLLLFYAHEGGSIGWDLFVLLSVLLAGELTSYLTRAQTCNCARLLALSHPKKRKKRQYFCYQLLVFVKTLRWNFSRVASISESCVFLRVRTSPTLHTRSSLSCSGRIFFRRVYFPFFLDVFTGWMTASAPGLGLSEQGCYSACLCFSCNHMPGNAIPVKK